MDMLDQALDSGDQDKSNDSPGPDQIHIQAEAAEDQDDQQHITLDPNIQYALRTDTGSPHMSLENQQYHLRTETAEGQVTYRVVQVPNADGGETAAVVTSGGFPTGAQAVIQTPFNGGSPNAQADGETRFAYFPAVTGAGDAQGADQGVQLGQVSTAGGQFYVMMSPQDVLQGQRTIAPRTHPFAPKLEGGRTSRDERRRATHNEGEFLTFKEKGSRDQRQRATHNEVERRRRDKINSWIVQLSKLVPECQADCNKAGTITNQSKGGILAKACDYITELRNSNSRMAESLKETERVTLDSELLRQTCEELRQENNLLRAQMQQQGIVPQDLTGAS